MAGRVRRGRRISGFARLVGRCSAVVVVAALAGSGLVAVPPGAAPSVAPVVAQAAARASSTGAEVAERPDEVSAALAARVQQRPVEVTGLRSESGSVWVNPDGSRTLRTWAGPVRVRRAGRWVPVDTTLVRDGGRLRPAAAPATVAFSAGGDGPAASLTGPAGAFELRWPGRLPAPRVDGNRAVYSEVAPGVDLVLAATVRGFEQYLLVRRRPTRPLTVRLPVGLRRLRMERAGGGELRLRAAAGGLVAAAPEPRMWAAGRDGRSGEPARSAPVTTTLVPAAGGAELLLRPDSRFLADPAVAYPVTIDPFVALTNQGDAYVQRGTSSNQNGSTQLRAGSFDGGATVARSLLKFDTARLAGRHVLDADLRLYETWSYSCSPRPVNVHRAVANWNPATVTWANQPGHGPGYASQTVAKGYSASCPAGWVGWDQTALVQSWANGTNPNYGFVVRAGNEADSYGWKKFSSSNNTGYFPELKVTYNSYPSAPLGRGVSPCTFRCAAQVLTASRTPRLSAAAADPDGGTLRYDFEVWDGHRASPTRRVAAGSTGFVTAGTGVAWTVPPGILTDGGNYEYRVRAFDGIDYGPWSPGWVTFTVDATVPTAPRISSEEFPAGEWAAATGGTFAWDSPSPDVTGWTWQLDGGAVTVTTAASARVGPLAPREHLLQVQWLMREEDPRGGRPLGKVR